MSNPNDIPPDSEYRHILHALDLLEKQVKSGRVETDYALRQVQKIRGKLIEAASEEQSQNTMSRFEALYRVSRILGTSLDLQTVLDQAMDAVIQLTGAERGFLMLSDDDGDLTVKAARNYDQQTLSAGELEYSRTVANLVIDSGEAILTTNATEDPRFKGQHSVISQALRSIMVAPLMARGRIIGIAYVENRVIAGLFTAEDLETLEALAGQASVAIDNALLFAETDEMLSKRVDELRLLRRIDLQLNQKLDAQDAMRYTLETVCRISQASEGHLGLIQEEPRRIIATHHFLATNDKPAARRENPVELHHAYPRAWEAIESRQIITFDTGQYSLKSVLIAPIMLDDDAIGVVILSRADGESFTVDEQDLIERVVGRAAINIENGRLFDAVKAANDAKTEFVGIVAHDLKAPMTSIQGYADLMLMQADKLEDRQKKFLERISGTVRRMERLVSDLADVSRIESGQFLMDEMRVKTETVLEAVRDTVMPQIEEREHQYVEEFADDLPDMFTDYFRLVQVLVNLLSNAYKYTPNGGTIILRVHHADDRVYFSVSDTGIGLSADQIKHLGQPFWRAEDDFTHSQPGTGLGFYITRSLVEQMGSRIEIRSVVGEGSTFSFSVAVATDDVTRSLI